MPITDDAEATALDAFLETGELPRHQRLARQMVARTLRLPHPRSIRELLLSEATHDDEVVSAAARTVIRLLVASGLDVASRNFLDEDMELPEFGTLGLHLLGWPECLIRAPHEDQALRVLQDLKELRTWTAGHESNVRSRAKSAATFFKTGELPAGPKLRECVLVYGEFLALQKCLGDEQDEGVMQAFDHAATATGDDQEPALRALQAIAAEGRIC
tara:strand:+ start:5487 stop:6134 length:648 start_codon:yes stop_codon:yes gene_type:complete